MLERRQLRAEPEVGGLQVSCCIDSGQIEEFVDETVYTRESSSPFTKFAFIV
jgi:hypothetical protein